MVDSEILQTVEGQWVNLPLHKHWGRMTLLQEGLVQELGSDQFFDNPYPTYQRLRETTPVGWHAGWSQWLVTSHSEVQKVLLRPDIFSSAGADDRFLRQLPQDEIDQLPHLARYFETSAINNSDPPEHTRFRRLIGRPFAPRVVEDQRIGIGQLVEELIKGLERTDRFDLMGQFALPLPAAVIAQMLGVSTETRAEFQSWSESVVAFVSTGYPQIDRARKANESIEAFGKMLEPVFESKRIEPTGDLASLLVATIDGEQLTTAELLAAGIVLLFAGHETTANLIGNGLLALLRHPDQMVSLKEDSALMTSAVEEMLRWDAPVQRARRVCKEDFDLGGQRILAGQGVMAFIGAANRDPEVFREPDEFNCQRENARKHLSFGHGIHACLGAPLSRLEAPIALTALLDTFPQMSLDPDRKTVWKRNITFRGLEVLPLITRDKA
jgi:cytochrome P450